MFWTSAFLNREAVLIIYSYSSVVIVQLLMGSLPSAMSQDNFTFATIPFDFPVMIYDHLYTNSVSCIFLKSACKKISSLSGFLLQPTSRKNSKCSCFCVKKIFILHL